MDAFKQLSLEIVGIEKILSSYSTNSSACNILPSLKQSISNKDKDEIIYCLQVIIDWYEKNISSIHLNQFCFNDNEHDRVFDLVKQIRSRMDDCDITNNINDINDINESEKKIIFLSHSSSDSKYGNALEKFIMGLGVGKDQLIYTSHPLHKIPLDENIYDFLRKNINSKVFMIILWSKDYLDSPSCLNEMGAAWIIQCDYTNIYVPQFSFENPKYHQCAVDTRKIGAVLNGNQYCKQAMIEFKNKIIELFELKIDEKESMFLLDSFIDQIKEDKSNG